MQKSSSLPRSLNHLKQININDEYGTPYDLYRMACKDYGIDPQIDVCASDVNHVLPVYFTIDDDWTKHDIVLDFFMNPPYSDVRKMMWHAYDRWQKNNVNVLILVYAKTDTKWWHEYVEGQAEIHFVKGRIKFNDHKGQPTKHSAPYPSVWIIFRKRK